MSIREDFINELQHVLPGVKALKKSDSAWFRFLGWLLEPLVPDFMDRFSNAALDGNIYLGAKVWDSMMPIDIMAHEAVHQINRKRNGVFAFLVSYLFPQNLVIFSPLSLVAIWGSLWWLLCLLFLLFALPIPAPFRRNEELDGYLMSICCWRWLEDEKFVCDNIHYVIKHFTSKEYYWMWPIDPDTMARKLLARMRAIAADPKSGGVIYEITYDFLMKVKPRLATSLLSGMQPMFIRQHIDPTLSG